MRCYSGTEISSFLLLLHSKMNKLTSMVPPRLRDFEALKQLFLGWNYLLLYLLPWHPWPFGVNKYIYWRVLVLLPVVLEGIRAVTANLLVLLTYSTLVTASSSNNCNLPPGCVSVCVCEAFAVIFVLLHPRRFE